VSATDPVIEAIGAVFNALDRVFAGSDPQSCADIACSIAALIRAETGKEADDSWSICARCNVSWSSLPSPPPNHRCP
jgi:hypothetical protein